MAALPTLMKLTTPLGDKVLNFSTMTAVEEMGRLYDYNLVVLGEKNDIDPKALLGKPASVALELSDQSFRHFHGIVTRFGLDGAQGRFYAYGMTLRPWLWLLSRRADTRIFQNMSIPDILKKVFGFYSSDYAFELSGAYATLDYCVQYRETDFNFVSRLMEQEGIYYFFRHSAGQHIMVLADKTTVHVPMPGQAEFRYRPQSLGQIEYEAITEWRFSQEIQPGKVTLNDYNFITPGLDLMAAETKDRGHSSSSLEYYDPPGDHLSKGAGERYAKLRVEELHARYATASGFGTMSGLATGYRFTLKEHPRKDQNREHIVVSTRMNLRHAGYESGNDGEASYTCQFTALDSREVFRPQRITPKPVVPGPQTALVVGPAGDEIHTDVHGRIKVQFHWDRLGKKDQNSSCWIRVASPLAGKGFGMVTLPRIGHEVVVEFLEGDPDRPLVTGSVYNGENVPPYALPANATVSTLKSRSSKGGAASNFNELRFEDKKGSEHLWLQAEKDQSHLVKNNLVVSIGHDENLTIGHDRNETIGRVQQLTVGSHLVQTIGGASSVSIGSDMALTIGSDQNVSVGSDINVEATGDSSHKTGKDMHVTAGMNYAVEGGMDIHLTAGMNVVIEAGMSLTLKAGANSIVFTPAGVSITGTMIMLNSGGSAVPGKGSKPKKPAKPEKPQETKSIKDPHSSR